MHKQSNSKFSARDISQHGGLRQAVAEERAEDAEGPGVRGVRRGGALRGVPVGSAGAAKKNIKKPIVVIGGINQLNYKILIKAGAKYIAISSFIWDNPKLKPEVAIKKFK